MPAGNGDPGYQGLLRAVDRVPGGRWLKDAAKAALDRTNLPYAVRLRMHRMGFRPETYALYELYKNDPADYLPDDRWRAMADMDGESVKAMLGNKLLFHHTYRDDLPLPELFATIARGRLVPNRRASSAFSSLDDVLAYVREVGPVMLKPIFGQKGKRIRRVEHGDDGLLLDGRPTEVDQLGAVIRRLDAFILTEYAAQAAYAKEIFPGSANTLRIVTMRDPDTDEPFVATAIHRFGRTASIPVDNFSSGGVFAAIDPETGVLGRLQLFDPRSVTVTWIDDHPDTSSRVLGREVPGWFDVVDDLMEFLRRHTYLSYIGWDIVKTDDGMRVLEANYGSFLQIQAVHPFLSDPRIRRFLDARGITSPTVAPHRPSA